MRRHIEVLHGDLIRSDERVLAHGCNTRGIMGAGIAAQMAETYPLVLHTNQRDVKAGLFVPGTAQLVVAKPGRVIFNLATQDDPGPRARLAWVELAFRNMAEKCVHDGIQRVAIPQIGCGLGGLVWPDVEAIIHEALADVRVRGNTLDVICYLYQPGKPFQR